MAPIPKKELMARMRRKKREDEEKWNEHLTKERERQKKIYRSKKEVMSDHDLKNLRAKTAAKVQKHRMKKKLGSLLPTTSPKKGTYKSPQSFGKAISKVCRTLPKSPSKRKAVIKEIVKRNFESDACKNLFTNTRNLRKEKNEKTIAEVFYCNDDISRQAPGKRDVRSIRNKATGKKEKIPLRYMQMNITDAYFEFKKRNPEIKMSLSSFFSCRPAFVLPASKTPHNVCVCKKHLNFSFMVEAIHTVSAEFPASYKVLLNTMCCDMSNENCMFNKCKKCQYDLNIFLPQGFDLNTSVKWKKWEEVNGFLQVSTKVCAVENLLEDLKKQLPIFKEHCYIKDVQYKYFDSVKGEKDRTKAIIQVDFAENATLTEQNQIQSAHWKQRQVTIFTCVIWSGDEVKSLAIISDELSHSKYAVWTFLQNIGQFIKRVFPEVHQLIFFSDNAASQFRSKYTVSNLCYLEDDLGFWSIEWVTFAASHGKGAVDGVGAALKNMIWNRVKSENLTINSAKEYYEEVLKSSKNVTVFFVSSDVIKDNEKILNERWEYVVDKIQIPIKNDNDKESCKKIPRKHSKKMPKEESLGLNSFHFFQKSTGESVFAARTVLSDIHEIKVFENQGEEVDKVKVWHYSDVYSDTSSDEEKRCDQPLTSSGSPSTRIPSQFELTGKNIHPDTYVLVELKSEVTKKIYHYVGVCQSSLCEEEGEVLIMFMKMYGKDAKSFIMQESDTKFIKFEQIMKILRPPKMSLTGNRILYTFDKGVKEVYEM